MTVSFWVRTAFQQNLSYTSFRPAASSAIRLVDQNGNSYQVPVPGEIITDLSQSSDFFKSYSIESSIFSIAEVSSVPPPDPLSQDVYFDFDGNQRAYQQWYLVILPTNFIPILQISGTGFGQSTSFFPAGTIFESGVLGPNLITGTPFADFLFGGDGSDRILALEGDDTVSGGGGPDEIHGGSGDDQLEGNDGNDWISGDEGNDLLVGNEGNDRLLGGEGNDLLYGGVGIDQLTGGAGDDLLYGGVDIDQLTGGAGDDLLVGDSGDDVLTGGDGNDQLYGGAGVDQIIGGAGDDLLAGGSGDDVLAGGDGNDIFVLFTAAVDEDPTGFDTIIDYQSDEIILVPDGKQVVVENDGVNTFINGALEDDGGDGPRILAVLLNYTGAVNVRVGPAPQEPESTNPDDPMMGMLPNGDGGQLPII